MRRIQPVLPNNTIAWKTGWGENDRHADVEIENFPKLGLLRDNSILFDTVFEIPGVQRYPGHKAILAVVSEYFRTLFAGRFKQSDTVILHNVDAQTLDLYLDMIYGKKLSLVTGDSH